MIAGSIHVFFKEAGSSDLAGYLGRPVQSERMGRWEGLPLGLNRPTFPLQKKGPVGIITVLYFGGFSEE